MTVHKKLKIFGKNQKVNNPNLVKDFLVFLQDKSVKSHRDLEKLKRSFLSKKKQSETIQNRDILAVSKESGMAISDKISPFLQKRAVRTISGVSPIGVLTKPYACPGRCVYCPTEDRMPKSYMKNQPAAARALRNNFHPFDQVQNRIIALEESGHPVSKLEVIVMGGTWSFLPHKYQSWYIRKLYEAANQTQGLLPTSSKDSTNDLKTNKKQKNSLKIAQHINETAEKRVIGLTLETRPDFINEKELARMRKYGCTRIEIGVQTLNDEIQRLTKRGHDRRHVFRAMRLMKDYGFKICWHLMPGLPGSDPAKDLEVFRETFENADCRPDMIKIYPCVVLETAELKNWWKEGKYKPYSDEEIVKLLIKMQVFVPPWVRIMRLMRDIPVSNILDGAKFSNLRQILTDQPKKLKEVVGDEFFFAEKLDKKGFDCQDIRSREVGFNAKEISEENKRPILVQRDYEANGGLESFLSFESADKKYLYALLRLRKPNPDFSPQNFRSVLGPSTALIREVHSYGSEVSVGDEAGLGQHRGLGKKLLAAAEKVAKENWGSTKIAVISGVGTREYYKKFGYELQIGGYMVKLL